MAMRLRLKITLGLYCILTFYIFWNTIQERGLIIILLLLLAWVVNQYLVFCRFFHLWGKIDDDSGLIQPCLFIKNRNSFSKRGRNQIGGSFFCHGSNSLSSQHVHRRAHKHTHTHTPSTKQCSAPCFCIQHPEKLFCPHTSAVAPIVLAILLPKGI